MAKEPEEAEKTTKITKTKTRRGWRIAKTLVVLALIVTLATAAGYFYKKYTDLKKNPASSQEAQKQENQRIIQEVGKLYSLPKDEDPTIFLVSDKDKLSDDYKKQEFFQKAENGDYILIYEKAKLALLYRPSENKLVDARPYTVQSTLSIALIGPETLRSSAEKSLNNAYKNQLTIVAKKDSKGTNTGVTVVDVSGKSADQAQKIADTLKGKVGNLPEGESKPEGADIVIILGNGQQASPAQ